MNLDIEKLDNLIKKDVSVFIENYDYIVKDIILLKSLIKNHPHLISYLKVEDLLYLRDFIIDYILSLETEIEEIKYEKKNC